MSQDSEFEAYMRGKSGLSKSYGELPQIELPDHLDAAILAEAHRAVGARPESRPRRRWVVPLSMVASLFVAVIIGLQLPYLSKGPAGPQIPQEEPLASAAQDKATKSMSIPPAERARAKEAPASPNAPAGGTLEKLQPAPEPAAQGAAGNAMAGAAPAAPESRASAAAPAPPAAAPAPAIAARRERVRAEPDNMGTAAESKPMARPEGYAGDLSEQAAPVAAPAAAPAEMEAQPKASLKDEASTTNLSPAEWLARIKRLKQEGKLDEARKELAAFKKRYPDYRVPAAIEVR